MIGDVSPFSLWAMPLMRAGVAGTVRVGFTAHTDSRVESVAILHSDHPDFADAARNAVSQ